MNLLSLSKPSESINNNWGKTPDYCSNSTFSKSRNSQIDASKNTASTQKECKPLTNYRNNQVRQGNSIFSFSISDIMSFSHSHYSFWERGISLSIFNKCLWVWDGSGMQFSPEFLTRYYSGLTIYRLISHEFFSKAFTCFSAGHLRNLLMLFLLNCQLAGMNLLHLTKQNLTEGNHLQEQGSGKADLLYLYLLISYPYLNYALILDRIQGLLSGVFLGRPIRTSFSLSNTSGAYIASCVKGFIPSLVIRCRKVLTEIFSSFDISESVKPVISSIIGKFTLKIVKCTDKSTELLELCIVVSKKKAKNVIKKVQKHLTSVLISVHLII